MKTINKSLRLFISAAILNIIPFLITGCDIGGDIVIPSGATELSVNVKADDNISDNPADVVVITEAKALITDIQYERERDGLNQLHHTGPYVISLDLNGSLKELMKGYVVRDIYTKAKFQVHKAEDGQQISDPEFIEGTGENQRYSFIVKGTYNGTPFIYKSKKSMDIVINFNKSSNVKNKTHNFTMLFNKTGWFKNGTTVLNPNLPQNADMIDNNIKSSFRKVFLDDNKDGVADDN
ncbi:MAG: hypothetical protein J0M37_04140 [Ignavibacteria bacterium]|nr:hypothetical protein [Ignavibacteria bacterium]